MPLNSDQRVQDVFLSVSRCPNVQLCIETTAPHACREIVEYKQREQGSTGYDSFQLPEPWVGEIDRAPIMFVSSNPSIGDDDLANGSTSDQLVWQSHHFAHGGGDRQYILDGIRTVTPDGSPLKAVRYWSWALGRVRELITHRAAVPGVDYAMTEIVHCKSRNENGVAEAAATCTAKHMDNIMSVAAAEVFIVVGVFAQTWFLGKGIHVPTQPIMRSMGGRTRMVAFLSHPAAFGGLKTLATRYSESDLQSLVSQCRK